MLKQNIKPFFGLHMGGGKTNTGKSANPSAEAEHHGKWRPP